MENQRQVLGLFPNEDKTVSAIEALENTHWGVDRVHSPFPSHKIFDALKLKPSRVGFFTLIGGILGFFFGFALAVYAALQWKLIVWGKPVLAWFPFIIVGFEFTILFSVIGNVLGLLIQSRLPDYKGLDRYDPRCSGEFFGILASCDEGEQKELEGFFQEKGGEVRFFD